jgi:ABC-type transporter Mla subunit MlaD
VSLSPVERSERRRQRRRAEIVRWGIVALVVLIVFGFGVALGQALHDNPSSSDTVTLERTLTIPSVPPGSTVSP